MVDKADGKTDGALLPELGSLEGSDDNIRVGDDSTPQKHETEHDALLSPPSSACVLAGDHAQPREVGDQGPAASSPAATAAESGAGIATNPDVGAACSSGSTGDPGAGPSCAAARVQPSYINIMVAPDISESSGGANFYTVDSESSGGQTFRTRRRFDNLVALHESLKADFRGCIVPSRPAKTAMNSSQVRAHGEKFLSERAHEIEAYLNQVARHVEMRDSEALKMFMESPEELLQSEDWHKAQPPKGGGFVGGLLHSLKKAVGAESSVPTPYQIRDTASNEGDIIRMLNERRVPRRVLKEHADHTEKDLETAKEEAQDGYKAVSTLAKRAEELMDACKRMEDVANDMAFMLNELRDLQASRASAAFMPPDQEEVTVLESARDCLLRTFELYQRRRRRDLNTLSKLHEHMAKMPRVVKALLAREAALISLETVRRQQDDINKTYALLSEKEAGAGLTRGEVARMNKARGDRDVVQQTVEAADDQYQLLRRRNLRDVAAYQQEHCEDMHRLVTKLAFDQAETSEKEGNLWETLARALGADVSAYGEDLDQLDYARLEPVSSMSRRLVEDL